MCDQGNPELEPLESQFLIAEFEKAWDMVFLLDERRTKVLQFYSVVFAGIVGLVATLLAKNGTSVPEFSIPASVAILLSGALMGIAVVMILWSERKANVRYRNKINLIRGLLLKNSTNPTIKTYLTYTHLGIKTHDDSKPPSGWGSTLSSVLIVVVLEIATLASGALLLIIYG